MDRSAHLSQGAPLLALAIVLAGALMGQSPIGSPATHPASAQPEALPANSHDEAFWDHLTQQLASDDFDQRQAAQKVLGTIDYREKEHLIKLADANSDAEVKARLRGRVDAIDTELAWNPPPISLNLVNAPGSAIVAALGKEMGVNFRSVSVGQGAFTIKADRENFWDIMAKLNAQSPQFRYISTDRGSITIPVSQRYVQCGGFIVAPQTLIYTRRIDLQGRDAATGPQLNLTVAAFADPRISVSQYAPPRIISAMDDAGNVLGGESPEATSTMREVSSMLGSVAASFALTPPERPGKTFSMKGEAKFVVVVKEAKMEVLDVAKHKNEPITIGGQTLRVTKFDIADALISTKRPSDYDAAVALLVDVRDVSRRRFRADSRLKDCAHPRWCESP